MQNYAYCVIYAKTMKIELKNIKHRISQSEVTNAFTAEIHIKGKRIAFARNSGKGGDTYFRPYKGCEEILEKVKAYAEKLPMVEDLKMDLVFYVDLQVEKHLKTIYDKQAKAVMFKLFKKSIVYRDQNGAVSHIEFKRFTIANMLNLESGRKTIRDMVEELKKNGAIILNNNIDKAFIE